MIRLVCTHCRNVLTIDDAFAGGVCRCQHCGTIQTVPARGAEAATGESLVGRPVASARPTYARGDPAAANAGTGLDDLANVVVSSGLSSARLTRGPAAKPRANLGPLFAVVGLVILTLLGVIAYLATRPPAVTSAGLPAPAPGGGSSTGRHPAPARINPPPARAADPVFCGVPLSGASTVVYLLDRGSATQELVPALRDAALRSAESLGSDRKFQVVFWTIDGDTPAYPESGPTYASTENVAAARQAFGDVQAFGNTDVLPDLSLALAKQPDVIVLATAKEYGLDDDWVKKVMDARGSGGVRIDTFSLAGHGDVAALRDLAAKTGGTYRDLGEADLRDAGR